VVADAKLLFAAHRDGVFRYLSRIVGYGEAGELTQEVFLRVSRGPVPSAGDAACRAWVFSIARNLALNHRGTAGAGAQPSSFTTSRLHRRRKWLLRCARPSTGWRRSTGTCS
jgi:DNA-directed RNA polymerase specialized sigma24 family protein